MESATQQISGFVVTYGIKVVGAIVFLVVGRILAGAVRRLVKRVFTRRGVDSSVTGLVANLSYVLILVGVIIAVLGQFGVETASFVAVLGALGFALGFALQGSLSNFASGVMILVFRPFTVGDMIDAAGVIGQVVEIQLFNTIINTPDNVRIIVPSSQIYGGTIKNYSANEKRRVDWVMGIGYGSSIGEAIEVMRKIINSDARVDKDPEPFFGVGELADSSVNITVRVWCDTANYGGVKFDLTRRFKEAFDEKNIEIPFPQQVVWHQNRAE